MFRLYRQPIKDEFFVIFGDTAQGGLDSNFIVFMSKSQQDIPLVLQMNAVASEMTPYLIQALDWIYEKTKVKPVVALERQNGGASEMHTLHINNKGNYRLYQPKNDQLENKDRLGWDTNSVTRPTMLGDWLVAFNTRRIKIYDEETIKQHKTFIVNKRNRAEAAPNTHDDSVMACSGAFQLFQTENALSGNKRTRPRPKRSRFHV
jgi:hypothetical protein